jgi:hypothetical protein
MKTPVPALFLLAILSLPVQALDLQVKAGAPTPTARPSAGNASGKTLHQGGNIQINLHNTDAKPGNYTVSWQFLAKSAADGSHRVYDKGSRKVSLPNGQSTAFEVNSREIKVGTTHYMNGSRAHAGDTTAGYVVLVKQGERVVAAESSDPLLKKKYDSQIAAGRMLGQLKQLQSSRKQVATQLRTSRTARDRAQKKLNDDNQALEARRNAENQVYQTSDWYRMGHHHWTYNTRVGTGDSGQADVNGLQVQVMTDNIELQKQNKACETLQQQASALDQQIKTLQAQCRPLRH